MKKLSIIILVFSMSFVALAQKKVECDNSTDCISKANGNNFASTKIAYLEKALSYAKKEKINPSDIYLLMARADFSYGELKTTEKYLKNAIKADEKNFWAHAWMAAFYRDKEKDYKKTDEYLTSLFKIFPDDPRVYHERAQNHLYNNLSASATDFEMGFNLMFDEPEKVDDWTKAGLARFHAITYMRMNKKNVADAKVLEILEKGYSLVKNNERLCGELALAYYDNDQMAKAKEMASIAVGLGENNVGRFVLGMDVFYKNIDEYNRDNAAKNLKQGSKYFWNSATAFSYSAAVNDWNHPLINFYAAICGWYYNSVDNPNGWSANVGLIKSRFNSCLQTVVGTKYESHYAPQTRNYLAELNK